MTSTIYSSNKKARFDYEVLETYIAGVKLYGHEVKSVKKGSASLRGAFVIIRGGEPYLTNVTIPPYQERNLTPNYDPQRTRKLLLNKKEVQEIEDKLQAKGLTLVPLRLYNNRGLIKVEIGLMRGKKKYDKRETIKKREAERKIIRSLKS
ncbi:SsrA-binding protein [Candidatus Curtissbacteria bacterium RIFCSPHIGHO2_02_FULL_40_17]|uniref:SsrA-binding protein n=2 Tax=Patescibacteria group TaxID=1783273 RepID=A0A1G2HGE3_9BACT|nr:MAG: SsrA-binding protein [Candidatus Curtissbacteria bacterium RIFCSPHIGHO2_02_FULL_40_17]OGZ58459.1 MAG: SsrA-binding protein [Candidatus Spechtbacteria bacterium RIFCSPHIGHO2_01_FULL_38_11]OGZ58954.1 MAG: SsrA-binding protein [Candidatus Spechtbacteria bacterium RIFCSPHIGHO2_12_FULL_38_30]OGZ61562.1 MAG: SsrA-binding protein [Candidatus Spechtbacteria bacterium RIFCSPLOWO2_12_FULL_38_22]